MQHTREISVTRSQFLELVNLFNNHQGTTKPEEFVAAVCTLFDVHPDYLGTTKVTAGRLRSQWKGMQESFITHLVERLLSEAAARAEDAKLPPAPEVLPDAPQEVVEALVSSGVSEHVVRSLWAKRPYWVKVQCKVFCELVQAGMVDSPDAFFTSAVMKGWLLCRNYDKNFKNKREEQAKARLEEDLAAYTEVTPLKPTEASKKDRFLAMVKPNPSA